ncbi:thioredoxin domain-containing protein [Nocardia panacis]|uniref:Thioredoxin domain-containing protein n=1 Tax=Nocardia panacis TaxID=2340916 RepID=A0A3A4KC22_9NOCA|nr:thioredoxin domain-containing protein [Nocardia panacis]RJO75823.1 thioredoxin domain-containing protein [Nocardia panacis]
MGVNQLATATSPYLRQHADNPVDWRQWDAEALAEAAARDVPILLSVGYASCHWCHVMAHESFEDAGTARVMNEGFVCVKVDREERPDLDAIYMNATVAMTGQGGWPMTCFLTPAGEPFYCGTYYPKAPRGGMPSFTQVLAAVAQAWQARRDEVHKAAEQVAVALREQASGLPEARIAVNAELLDGAVAAVLGEEDVERGGFGGAPKFPPSAQLEGLLRGYERTGKSEVLQAVSRTAVAMARGGIYDQLRGGFARYSVDAGWVVPHFEKMLYDNALLLRVYAHLARRDGSELAHRIVRETAEFLLDDLGTAAGGFASGLDADTQVAAGQPGVEGATYVWTPAELIGVLGPADGAWAAELLGVRTAGNFEQGASVLTRYRDPDDAGRFARVRTALRAARAGRPQPARDDKVITAWNGMAITALAEAGAALGQPDWLAAAARCARHVLSVHVVDGRVLRASLEGVAGNAAGILEDYAWLATGLLALYQATGRPDWLVEAQSLLDKTIQHFTDPAAPGSWFDTADDAETLVTRPRDPVDGATPSGASAVLEALLTAAASASDTRYRQIADQTLARGAVILSRIPRAAGHWLAAAEAALHGPLQIAIATPDDPLPLAARAESSNAPTLPASAAVPDATTRCAHSFDSPIEFEAGMWPAAGPLLTAARMLAPGGAVIVAAQPDSVPLLEARPLRDGVPAAYVCRGSVCDLPVTTVEELRASLERGWGQTIRPNRAAAQRNTTNQTAT